MKRREGISTIEVLMAILIMATAVTAVSQVSAAISRQQRLARQRATAMQEAANLLESQLARSWSGQPADGEPADGQALARKPLDGTGGNEVVELSAVARQLLPQAAARVEVTSQQDAPVPSERVVVTIEWSQTSYGPQTLRLVGWRFRSREPLP
jgi:Tfp pilus assembly protein PilV